MGLNINLFVHGVPMGQKIWGPKGEDQSYLSSFYGPKWDAPELMKVDVMTFGGTTYCYYSFVKGQNVCDSQGRAGSYFALTLRLNAYYADVQNMYNILKAAYDKMCVGVCVSERNNIAKYLLADFQNIDNKLKAIETNILNYVSEFSISEDILSFSGIPAGSSAPSQSFNLHECVKSIAFEAIKSSGKLMVSPYYLSANAAKTVAQYKSEMQATTQKAQQEILLQQKASQEKISAITQQSNERIDSITKQSQEDLRLCKEQARQKIEQVQEQSAREIAATKESYADVDLKMNTLRGTIKEREREIGDLQQQCRRKDKELQTNNKSIEKLKQTIERLQNDVESIRNGNGGPNPRMPEPKKINWLFVGIISFFIVLLIGGLTYFVMSSTNTREKESNEFKEQINASTDGNDPKAVGNAADGVSSTDDDTPGHYKINVDFVNASSIGPGGMCKVSLIGEGRDTLKGKWVSEGFKISNDTLVENNIIIAKRESIDTIRIISYYAGETCIASKSIPVK